MYFLLEKKDKINQKNEIIDGTIASHKFLDINFNESYFIENINDLILKLSCCYSQIVY